MMKKLVLVLSSLVLVSCGGGSSPAASSSSEISSSSKKETSSISHTSRGESSASSRESKSLTPEEQSIKEKFNSVVDIEKNRAEYGFTTTGYLNNNLYVLDGSGQRINDNGFTFSLPAISGSFAVRGLDVLSKEDFIKDDIKDVTMAYKMNAMNAEIKAKSTDATQKEVNFNSNGLFGTAAYIEQGVGYINLENLHLSELVSAFTELPVETTAILNLVPKVKIDLLNIDISSYIEAASPLGATIALALKSMDVESLINFDLIRNIDFSQYEDLLEFSSEGGAYKASLPISDDIFKDIASYFSLGTTSTAIDANIDENSAISIYFDENHFITSKIKITGESYADYAESGIAEVKIGENVYLVGEKVVNTLDIDLSNVYQSSPEISLPKDLSTYSEISDLINIIKGFFDK